MYSPKELRPDPKRRKENATLNKLKKMLINTILLSLKRAKVKRGNLS